MNVKFLRASIASNQTVQITGVNARSCGRSTRVQAANCRSTFCRSDGAIRGALTVDRATEAHIS